MHKIIFIVLGTICLALGIIGIVLPILPTTPFLLLTSYFYFRSSNNLYNKLMANKYLGPYIKNFKEEKAIPLHTKIVIVSLLWLTIGSSALFFTGQWWLRILLCCIAIGVTIHILSYKTKR